MTSLELRDLRLIWAIADAGGATAAGRSLGLTQSAVSHQLRGLEERLGVVLYTRSGRALLPTPPCEELLESAKHILPQVARLESRVRQAATSRGRALRVCTQCYTAYNWLPHVLPQLGQRHPDVQLQIVAEATRAPLVALQERRLDLALCIGKVSAPGFTAKKLFRDELVLVVSPRHRLASRAKSGELTAPDELIDDPVFAYDVSASDRHWLRQRLFPTGGGFRQITRLPLTEAITALVCEDQGISVLAGWSIAPQLQRGELCALPLSVGPLWRDWHGVYSTEHELAKPIAFLLRALQQHPPPAVTGPRKLKKR